MYAYGSLKQAPEWSLLVIPTLVASPHDIAVERPRSRERSANPLPTRTTRSLIGLAAERANSEGSRENLEYGNLSIVHIHRGVFEFGGGRTYVDTTPLVTLGIRVGNQFALTEVDLLGLAVLCCVDVVTPFDPGFASGAEETGCCG